MSFICLVTVMVVQGFFRTGHTSIGPGPAIYQVFLHFHPKPGVHESVAVLVAL